MLTFVHTLISVVMLPGTTIPYVALNGKPIYLQLWRTKSRRTRQY